MRRFRAALLSASLILACVPGVGLAQQVDIASALVAVGCADADAPPPSGLALRTAVRCFQSYLGAPTNGRLTAEQGQALAAAQLAGVTIARADQAPPTAPTAADMPDFVAPEPREPAPPAPPAGMIAEADPATGRYGCVMAGRNADGLWPCLQWLAAVAPSGHALFCGSTLGAPRLDRPDTCRALPRRVCAALGGVQHGDLRTCVHRTDAENPALGQIGYDASATVALQEAVIQALALFDRTDGRLPSTDMMHAWRAYADSVTEAWPGREPGPDGGATAGGQPDIDIREYWSVRVGFPLALDEISCREAIEHPQREDISQGRVRGGPQDVIDRICRQAASCRFTVLAPDADDATVARFGIGLGLVESALCALDGPQDGFLTLRRDRTISRSEMASEMRLLAPLLELAFDTRVDPTPPRNTTAMTEAARLLLLGREQGEGRDEALQMMRAVAPARAIDLALARLGTDLRSLHALVQIDD